MDLKNYCWDKFITIGMSVGTSFLSGLFSGSGKIAKEVAVDGAG